MAQKVTERTLSVTFLMIIDDRHPPLNQPKVGKSEENSVFIDVFPSFIHFPVHDGQLNRCYMGFLEGLQRSELLMESHLTFALLGL